MVTKTEGDFYIHEGEDIDLRVTIDDPDDDLTTIAGSTIVWVATGSIGGVPIITKGTGDSSIDIEDPLLFIIRIHLVQTDTRNLIAMLFYETSITIDGKRRVLRLVGEDTGTFEIKQSDTDQVVVA